LLVGSRTVITFDRLFVNINSKHLDEMCSHLLAHDFVNNQFTLILKTSIKSKILVVQTGSDKIELELGNPLGNLINGNNSMSALPAAIGELIVTRELNVVTISSKVGFTIECNLEFDVCSILLSGW
jgi:hypothetical protein